MRYLDMDKELDRAASDFDTPPILLRALVPLGPTTCSTYEILLYSTFANRTSHQSYMIRLFIEMQLSRSALSLQ